MEKKYIVTDCPVCNEFYFSELTEEDVQDGDDGLSRFCHVCGWKYNVEQIENPTLKNADGYDIAEF